MLLVLTDGIDVGAVEANDGLEERKKYGATESVFLYLTVRTKLLEEIIQGQIATLETFRIRLDLLC